jgi:D-glycero-D-manno-heptose 1,7-bisphosphate phosphatase
MDVECMKHKAVFLDRDGTINVDSGFIHRPEDFTFIDGAREALLRLKKMGFMLVVVTNQSGIARGLYTEEDVHRLHRYVNRELQRYGVVIDRFYFCPHHPEAVVRRYRKSCACRKPKPGMILQALSDLDIDAAASYLIGDMMRDICAGKDAGVTSILIQPHDGDIDRTVCSERPDYVVHDLLEASAIISRSD